MKPVSIVVTLFLLSFSVWAGTFLETFDDEDFDGWQELAKWEDAPGSWEIIDGQLHGASLEGFLRLLTIGDDTWKDYTVEFDVRPLKKHGSPKILIAARVSGTWLVRCYTAEADQAVVLPGANAPARELVFCGAGNLHRAKGLFLGPHSLLKLNRWAHLKLSVEGDTFTFWINEEQVMEPTELRIFRNREGFADFPDFRTGGVGLGLSNYTARFDNITVTGDSIPNSGGFAVTSQGKLATTWGELKQF